MKMIEYEVCTRGPKSWNRKHVDVTDASTKTDEPIRQEVFCYSCTHFIYQLKFALLLLLLLYIMSILIPLGARHCYDHAICNLHSLLSVFEAAGILCFIHFLRIIWHSSLLCSQQVHFSLFCGVYSPCGTLHFVYAVYE